MRSLPYVAESIRYFNSPLETPCLSLCTQTAVVSGKPGGAPRALAAGSAAWSQGGVSAGSAAAASPGGGRSPAPRRRLASSAPGHSQRTGWLPS